MVRGARYKTKYGMEPYCYITLACDCIVMLIIGYSTVFCEIREFICTSLRSTEIVSDER